MHSRTKVTPFQRKEMWRLHCSGHKNKDLASQLGIHRNTVGKIIKNARLRDFCVHKSVRADYRTFARANAKLEALSAKLKTKADRKAGIVRYEKERAGELGHIDVHKARNVRGQDPKKKKYLATLVDDATRLAHSRLLSNKKAKTLASFLRAACAWFGARGIRFRAVLTDNGKEFTTHIHPARPYHSFEKEMARLGIIHKYTRIFRPQTNGKVERWWRIFEEQFFRLHQFRDWKDFDGKFRDWMAHYNYVRPHGGIKGMTPWGKYELELAKFKIPR